LRRHALLLRVCLPIHVGGVSRFYVWYEGLLSEHVTSAGPELVATARSPRVRRLTWLPPLLVLLVLAGLWEGLKALFQIRDSRLPHISAIFAEFFTRTQGGQGPFWVEVLLRNAGTTLLRALAGFVLGGALGIGLAVLFARVRLAERGCLPFVIGSQTVPILAVAPMVVVGFGRLDAPEWVAEAVVAAYLTFFPVTIGMLRGLRSAHPDALALMRSYAASSTQTFLKLRFPAALPYLFTSLKVAATASVIGAIVAELPSGAGNGIGVMILNSTQYYNSRPTALYASVMMAALVGLVFFGLVALAERLVVKK
jgi:NitT/TauT family transport system permease protein